MLANIGKLKCTINHFWGRPGGVMVRASAQMFSAKKLLRRDFGVEPDLLEE